MRTRFAPAPTGYLHLGHLVNALAVWAARDRLGGQVVLRIEDHDRQRSRPEYDRALREDLAWLGLSADEQCRQSAREAVYQEALARLQAQGLIYACECSRRDLVPGEPGAAEARYPGTCRDRGLTWEPGRGLRVRLEPGLVEFADLRLGPQAQDPAAQCGDLLVRDRLGNWTYQFAVMVDDWRQDIDLVIRGEDLLPSTGRQIALARLLGRETMPRFLHHPLIHRPDGRKLSKSEGDTGIGELRARGLLPDAVLSLAASKVGWISSEESPARPELLRRVVSVLGLSPES